MRACSSASCAKVAAGVRARARSSIQPISMLASTPPSTVLGNQCTAGNGPPKCSTAQAYAPHSAPNATPVAYCSQGGQRCNKRLLAQVSTSQASVPDRPPLVSHAVCNSQSSQPVLV